MHPKQSKPETTVLVQQSGNRVAVAATRIRTVMVRLALLIVMCMSLVAQAADVNVLIVGTTVDKGSTYGGNSKAFDITKVRTELEKILAGAGLGSVHVGLHDLKNNSTPGNSLIAEFYSVNGSYPPAAADMQKELRGENGTDWNFIILADEPYTIEAYPGLYTLGVAEFGKEAAKGGAETVLFAGWPGSGSTSTVNHYKEVVYRTGRTLGYKVAPAGLAWQAEGSVHGATHPTNNGAYLAAASLFSRIWGRSASSSSYVYNDALADRVHQTVLNNIGKQQYTGLYARPSNVFTMMHNPARSYSHGGVSSSTENGLRAMAKTVAQENGLDMDGDGALPIVKGIYLNRDWIQKSEFAMQARFQHPGNGGYDSFSYLYYFLINDLSSYLSQTNVSMQTEPSWRHLPSVLLWAQFAKEFPNAPLIESSHGSNSWKRVQGAYLYTLLTGRCAIGPMPAVGTAEYMDYVANRIGYETAWRVSRLQGRAPGFKVLPSDRKSHAVDPLKSETMTVQFVLPAKQAVTVSVSTDKPWATVSPQTLTFAAGDVTTVKNVTVAVAPEASNLRGEVFNVIFSTTSTDEVCDGLSESWVYEVNSIPVPQSQSLEVVSGGSVDAILTTVDADPKQTHTYAVTQQPAYGTVVIRGSKATYVPNPGFLGRDKFKFTANDGMITSAQSATVDILVYPFLDYNVNLLFNPSAEYFPLPDFGMPGVWESVVGSAGAPARTGNRLFQIPSTITSGDSYQEVKLISYAGHIDAGVQYFKVGGFCKDGADDDVRLVLEFRDANGQVVGTPYVSQRVNSTQWTQIDATLLAPVGARVARFILRSTRLSGAQTDGMVEDISLIAIKPINSAPVATDPPLISIAVDVPTVIPLTATDVDADDLTYSIVPGKGPQFGSIVGQDERGMPIYKSNPGYLGLDSFTFVANDGQVNSNEAVANIEVRGNRAPIITINSPKTLNVNVPVYMTQTNGIVVSATVTDDGAPVIPGVVTYKWEKAAGTLTPTFSHPNSPNTTINWGDMNVGSLTVRLNAYDGSGLRSSKSIRIEVLDNYVANGNIAPQVDVGGPYTGFVGVPVQLKGEEYFNDNLPNPPGYTTVEWQLLSGPGNATFENSFAYETPVTFDAPGTYVLRLTGDDGWVKVYEDVSITITGQLIARAGADQTVTDTNGDGSEAVTLDGSDSIAAGGPITSYVWKKGGTQIATGATPTVTLPVGTHTIALIVTNGAGETATDTVVITVIAGSNQAPTVAWTVSKQTSTNESGTMTVTAQLSEPYAQPITVPFTVSGSAKAGSDYAITASPLTIPANSTSASVTISILGDTLDEANETVVLTMGTPTNAVKGTIVKHTAIIKDDDPLSVVTWTTSNQSSLNESGTLTVTAKLSVVSGRQVKVPFTLTGTAASGSDYTITASPVVIPAGQTTGTETITILADTNPEENETIILTMGSPTNATKGATTVHTATITNDDGDPPAQAATTASGEYKNEQKNSSCGLGSGMAAFSLLSLMVLAQLRRQRGHRAA